MDAGALALPETRFTSGQMPPPWSATTATFSMGMDIDRRDSETPCKPAPSRYFRTVPQGEVGTARRVAQAGGGAAFPGSSVPLRNPAANS